MCFFLSLSLSQSVLGLAATFNFSEAKKSGGWFGGSTYVNEVSGFVYAMKDEAQTPLATISGLAGEKLVHETTTLLIRVLY